MATQLTIYLTILTPLLLIWSYSLYATNSTNNKNFNIILSLPFVGIITLGIYALGSVINGVTKFNDCREAREELIQEIQEAKEDLRKRKII